jgi:hypothetical protein
LKALFFHAIYRRATSLSACGAKELWLNQPTNHLADSPRDARLHGVETNQSTNRSSDTLTAQHLKKNVRKGPIIRSFFGSLGGPEGKRIWVG